MFPFFLVLVLLHVAGAALSLVFGWAGGTESIPRHLTVGLLTALEGILLHCLFLFFITGTGSWIRKNLPDSHPEKPVLRLRVAGFRRRLFPLLLTSILLWMITTTLGGAASVQSVPPLLHGLAAMAATLVSFWTCRQGLFLVRENMVLLRGVEKLLKDLEAPMSG